jgi:hypothetical protein
MGYGGVLLTLAAACPASSAGGSLKTGAEGGLVKKLLLHAGAGDVTGCCAVGLRVLLQLCC